MQLTDEQIKAIAKEVIPAWAEWTYSVLAFAHAIEAACSAGAQRVTNIPERQRGESFRDWAKRTYELQDAQPLTQTDAARDVKRYHGRTIEDLKEICTTRPARYPQAYHDFDKTILALIDEIERLDRAKGE